jgi:hypothetical protein
MDHRHSPAFTLLEHGHVGVVPVGPWQEAVSEPVRPMGSTVSLPVPHTPLPSLAPNLATPAAASEAGDGMSVTESAATYMLLHTVNFWQ